MAKSTKKKAAEVARKPKKKPIDVVLKPKKLRRTAGRTVESVHPVAPVEVAADVLDRLWSVVMSRRDADPAVSHSARLLARGPAKVAQKFGEEAVECLIEAVAGNHDALVAESADVLYHLIVVWVSTGVSPDEVWTELKRREGISGIAEKAARTTPPVAQRLQTTKIP